MRNVHNFSESRGSSHTRGEERIRIQSEEELLGDSRFLLANSLSREESNTHSDLGNTLCFTPLTALIGKS